MTKTEQNKILEDKITLNRLNFNLNRQSAIVSVFADGNFDKYEYLTRIDLELKPNLLQKARFQYSPLGDLLNKKLNAGAYNEEDMERPDFADILDQLPSESSTSTSILEESRTPTPILEESRTPTPILEESRPPTPILEESRMPTPILEESRTSPLVIEESRTPTPLSDDLINKLKCLRNEVSDAKEKNSDMIKQINETYKLNSYTYKVKPIVDETYEIKCLYQMISKKE